MILVKQIRVGLSLFSGISTLLEHMNQVLLGEHPKGTPNNLLPYILQVAVGKRDKLSVFGNDYPTIDGTGVRDYIHVSDLVSGHLKSIDKIIKSEGVYTYNLGTGYGVSVLQLIEKFELETGIKIDYEITDRRTGDVSECLGRSK